VSPAPLRGLTLYLAALAIQRGHELLISAQNARRLRARGAVEHGRAQLLPLVAIHAALPIALTLEVLLEHARPPAWWPAPLLVLVLAELLRLWSMASLGEYWTARVLVVPGQPEIRTGPYRWIAHPSYAAAALELLAGPLMFGAWRTALVLTALNAFAIAARVRTERGALADVR
jgi:methyltransferase